MAYTSAYEILNAKQNGREDEAKEMAAENRQTAKSGFLSFLKDTWKGLTGQTSAEATLKANEMNIANQNYWNQMAMYREDTAHQREAADLQAAGLNPWLSVGGGAQSATMSTAQAEPVDGSKMLQATSAMAMLAITRLLSSKLNKETTRTIKKG